MVLRLTRPLVLSALCYLASGCTWQQRSQIYKVVDQYCDAEVRGDMAAELVLLTPESLDVLHRASQGAGIAGPASSPMGDWRFFSYKLTPDQIAIRGKKAYATVTATFTSSRRERKNITFTVYLKRYEEANPEGGTQSVWRINEIETRRRLAEQVVGKGYADLWIRQLQAQEEWQKATTSGGTLRIPPRH